MQKQHLDDETTDKQTLKPEAGKKINMVLSAEARHEAMLKRLHTEPLTRDLSTFVKDPQ
jgi:hypothetical protein